MMQAIQTLKTLASRRQWMWAATFAAIVAALPPTTSAAQRTLPQPASKEFMLLIGTVMDSIHNVPLGNAIVSIEGTSRSGVTNVDGEYRIDSIPPGQHRVLVDHPLLDSLGQGIRTNVLPFGAGESHTLDLYTPTGGDVARSLCNAAQRNRGPAVMLGFVKDPDTNAPAVGAKVSLVYYETNVIGQKSLRLPEVLTDSTGRYHICGLTEDMSGKVQVFRNGVSSGEVPVAVQNGVAIRAFSVVAHNAAVAEVKNDSGKIQRVVKGSARVTGLVLDKSGKPLVGARIALQGGGIPVVSGPGGVYMLDSLPSGTQALEVRKLGYQAEDVPVELSSAVPTKKNITLNDFVPTLAAMRVEVARDKALADVGYLERKREGIGHFMDSTQINHNSSEFSEVMRMAPGLRITPSGDGHTNVITDARNSTGGCVNVYVDGSLWQSMTPGDIDGFVRPDEMVAVEVYHGAGTPAQFTPAGQSSCATIVVWTVARIRPDNGSKKPIAPP